MKRPASSKSPKHSKKPVLNVSPSAGVYQPDSDRPEPPRPWSPLRTAAPPSPPTVTLVGGAFDAIDKPEPSPRRGIPKQPVKRLSSGASPSSSLSSSPLLPTSAWRLVLTQALGLGLASFLAHRCGVLGEALEWLWASTKVMFYLVPPHALALNGSDQSPTYFASQGLPMFFIMIAVEWAVVSVRDRVDASKGLTPLPGYRLSEALASLSLGTVQQLGLVFLEVCGLGIEVAAYGYVYDHYRLFTIDVKQHVWFTYFALLLGKDLAYYAAHRSFHEWHGLWIGHSNHHSGEDYNLATALRQGIQQPLVGWPFYLPLALMGFHPHAFGAHAQLNTLYMFWIHTDLIGQLPLPWLTEAILNTPSHHRVHHRPPGNCNYAGVFIVWDRLFGTFAPEGDRRGVFGLAKQPNTFDPLALNVNHLQAMALIVRAQQGKDTGTGTGTHEEGTGQGKSQGSGGSIGGASLASALAWGRAAATRRVPFSSAWHWRTFLSPVPPLGLDRRRDDVAVGMSWSDGRGRATATVGATVGATSMGRGRVRWDGATAQTPASALLLVGLILPLAVGSTAVLFLKERLRPLDAGLACACGLLGLGAAGRVADNQPQPHALGPRSRHVAQALACSALLAFAVVAQPARQRWP